MINRKNRQSSIHVHDLQFKNGELTQDVANEIDKWKGLHKQNEGLSKDIKSAKAKSHDLCLALSDLQKDLQKKEEEVETLKEWIEGQDSTPCEENLKLRQREDIVAQFDDLGSRLEAIFRVKSFNVLCQTQRYTIQGENVKLK